MPNFTSAILEGLSRAFAKIKPEFEEMRQKNKIALAEFEKDYEIIDKVEMKFRWTDFAHNSKKLIHKLLDKGKEVTKTKYANYKDSEIGIHYGRDAELENMLWVHTIYIGKKKEK